MGENVDPENPPLDAPSHRADPLAVDSMDDPSGILRYLLSLPDLPDSDPEPEPTVAELLEEAATPGGPDRIAAEARRRDPGPMTAQMLTTINPRKLGPAGLLDAVCAAERLASWIQATSHRYLSAFARPGVAAPMDALSDYANAPGQPLNRLSRKESALGSHDGDQVASGSTNHGQSSEHRAALAGVAYKVAAAEVSAALLVSPLSANRRVAQAVDFTEQLPATLIALRDGVIDRGRALVIADRTQNLPADQRRRVESVVVRKASTRTAGQLRGIADRAVIAVDPEAAKKRHEAARTRRGISVRPGEDGMSVFRADLTPDKAYTAFTVLDQLAIINGRNSAEKRNIGALRADVFTDIFDQLADHGSVHLGPLLGLRYGGSPHCHHLSTRPQQPTDAASTGPQDVRPHADNADNADRSASASTGVPDPSRCQGQQLGAADSDSPHGSVAGAGDQRRAGSFTCSDVSKFTDLAGSKPRHPNPTNGSAHTGDHRGAGSSTGSEVSESTGLADSKPPLPTPTNRKSRDTGHSDEGHQTDNPENPGRAEPGSDCVDVPDRNTGSTTTEPFGPGSSSADIGPDETDSVERMDRQESHYGFADATGYSEPTEAGIDQAPPRTVTFRCSGHSDGHMEPPRWGLGTHGREAAGLS